MRPFRRQAFAALGIVAFVAVVAPAAGPAQAGTVDTTVVITVTLSGNGQGYLRTGDGFINCVRSGGSTSGTCKHTYDLPGGPIPFDYTYASESTSCFVQGDACEQGGLGPAFILSPGDPDQSIGITFRLLNPVAITVKKSGSGTVKSTPRGINCGSDCKSDYAKGSSFTLKATPASGSTFSKWTGGPCDGRTSTTCAFTVGSGPYTVTAVFAKKGSATPAPAITEPPEPTDALPATAGPTPIEPTPFPSTATVPPPATVGPIATSPPLTPVADDDGRSTLILALGSLLAVILAAGALYAMRPGRGGSVS